MKKTQETLRRNVSTKAAVLHVAFELSNSKWKLGFSDGNKMRFKSIDARAWGPRGGLGRTEPFY